MRHRLEGAFWPRRCSIRKWIAVDEFLYERSELLVVAVLFDCCWSRQKWVFVAGA